MTLQLSQSPIGPEQAPAEADISVLVVAYNSAEFIADCLASIDSAATACRCEILLIDNGDGSTQALVERQFPHVRIVASRGNVGFAAANNILERAATTDKLLLVNPDMVLDEGSIDALFEGTRNHPEAAAWGGVTIDAAGEPDTGNAIAIPSLPEFVSLALGRSRVGSQAIAGLAADARVSVLGGGYVMFARSAWEDVGGLDERYFLYCEEVDLFVRLAQRGHVFWRIAAARGHHKVGHGSGYSAKRLLYLSAGTMQFVRLHWSRPTALLAACLLWLSAFERFAAGRLLGKRNPRFGRMSDGFRRVALEPRLWWHGYDPQKGLLARMAARREAGL